MDTTYHLDTSSWTMCHNVCLSLSKCTLSKQRMEWKLTQRIQSWLSEYAREIYFVEYINIQQNVSHVNGNKTFVNKVILAAWNYKYICVQGYQQIDIVK